ncbi:MAG: ATP-binding cassette domain-containing protein, partial [Chromatiaceae bacterium]
RDVSFQVRAGEILSIIGRNGAGKITLLKILSRITAPTRGQVKIKGRLGSLLEVGTGCHPELTGRENQGLKRAIVP